MREALGLLTTFGGARPLRARALAWFPVVGALLGALVGVTWWGTTELWPPAVAAVLVVSVDLALTGMLHVDGLADSADGLLPHATRDRRLQIMRSPDVGAFAVAVVAIVLLARVAAFGSAEVAPLVVVGVWCTARAVVAIVPTRVGYARDDGLASALVDSSARSPGPAVAVALLLTAVTLGVAIGLAAVLAVGTTMIVTIGGIALAVRRIGGFTGDVLGAAIVLGETAGLLVWAARW